MNRQKLWMQAGTNEVPAFDKELYKADSRPQKVVLKRTLLEISEIISRISMWLEGASSTTWDALSAQLLLDYPYNEERNIDALGIIFFFNKFLRAKNDLGC